MLYYNPASMSVKDVLQSLVDDSLVDLDRIGTSNYFWSFPSKAANNVSCHSKKGRVGRLRGLCSPLQSARKLKNLEEKLTEVRLKKAQLSKEVAEAQVGREDNDERSALLLELEKKQAQKIQLARELEEYKSCDPQTLKELSKEFVCSCVCHMHVTALFLW